jgi:hypothetical protein
MEPDEVFTVIPDGEEIQVRTYLTAPAFTL